MASPGASIIIVNWNGRHYLETTLPALIGAVARDGGDHEVIVVDNASEDESVSWMQQNHPCVCVDVLDRNLGSAGGFNHGAAVATRPLLVCLAADIRVEEAFLAPLLQHFQDQQVFAASPRRLMADGLIEHDELTYAINQFGLFDQIQHGLGTALFDRVTEPRLTWYAPMANAAFRKSMFLDLGGFGEEYGPIAVMGEADICYKAWKRGWNVVFDPRSVVWHIGGREIVHRRFTPDEVYRMLMRGLLLFTWENVTDRDLLLRHGRNLPMLLADGGWHSVFHEARRHARTVARRRRQERGKIKRTDHEVLTLLGSHGGG